MHFDAHNEMQNRFKRKLALTIDRLVRMEEDLSSALNSVSLEPKDNKMDPFG